MVAVAPVDEKTDEKTGSFASAAPLSTTYALVGSRESIRCAPMSCAQGDREGQLMASCDQEQETRRGRQRGRRVDGDGGAGLGWRGWKIGVGAKVAKVRTTRSRTLAIHS